jgi:E1A/CREB-binding protein
MNYSAIAVTSGAAPMDASVAATAGSKQAWDRKQVLRHQQQRVVLLRHAAMCRHGDGPCPVTPHCADMKQLWKHVAACENQKCSVPRCVSSRKVVCHYFRCKDVRCPMCGPIRAALLRGARVVLSTLTLTINTEEGWEGGKFGVKQNKPILQMLLPNEREDML